MTQKITLTLVFSLIVKLMSTANVPLVKNSSRKNLQVKSLLQKLLNTIKSENIIHAYTTNNEDYDSNTDYPEYATQFYEFTYDDGEKPTALFEDLTRTGLVKKVYENNERDERFKNSGDKKRSTENGINFLNSQSLRSIGNLDRLSTDYVDTEELRLRSYPPVNRIYVSGSLLENLLRIIQNSSEKGKMRGVQRNKALKKENVLFIENRYGGPDFNIWKLSSDYVDPSELYGSSSNLARRGFDLDIFFDSNEPGRGVPKDDDNNDNTNLDDSDNNKPMLAEESNTKEKSDKDAMGADDFDTQETSFKFKEKPKRFEVVRNLSKKRKIKDDFKYHKHKEIVKMSEEKLSSLSQSQEASSVEEQASNKSPVLLKGSKNEIYYQGPGHEVHISPFSDENFRTRPENEHGKRESIINRRSRSGYRLPYFLPKRIHWDKNEMRHLGYLWMDDVKYE